MGKLPIFLFAPRLDAALGGRDGLAVAVLLPQDPENRFEHGFNRHMSRVDASDIEAAYYGPLFVAAARVEAGLVPGAPALFKFLDGVQRRVGLKLGGAAARRANPQVKAPRGARHPDDLGRPLFAAGCGLDIQLGRDGDPSHAPLRRELFRVMLSWARGMGRLPARALREVRRYEARRGTRFGAFKAVARRAVLDGAGRVVAIRPEAPDDSGSAAGGTPAVRTVRQVRRLYEDAVGHLADGGIWSGPSGL